jgi:hypothetical protein
MQDDARLAAMQTAGFTWDFAVPPRSPDPAPPVSELLRDLEALRARLEQAPAWFSRPQDTLRAGALAEEVKRLCQESYRSDDDAEVTRLLDSARQCLDELQILLGSH